MSAAKAAELASQEGPIMGAKYLSVVALSCLLYDHVLHINDELTDIWFNFGRRPILKSLYLLGRYSAMVSVVYTAQSQAIFNRNITDQNSCRVWGPLTVIFVGLSLIGTEGIVIYRLRSLWKFNIPITRAIVAMATFAFIATIISMSLEANDVRGVFHPVEGISGCLYVPPSSKPPIALIMLGIGFFGMFLLFAYLPSTHLRLHIYGPPTFYDDFKGMGAVTSFVSWVGIYFMESNFFPPCCTVNHIILLLSTAFGGNSRLSTVPLVVALATIINGRIFHGVASEAEHYADEYNATLSLFKN